MHLQRQAPPDAAQGRVIRHGFGGAELEKFAQRKGIATAPADAAFRVDTLEVADQKHAEIPARRDGPAAEFFGIEGSAQLFEEGVKCLLVQELLQPLVKNMPLHSTIVILPYSRSCAFGYH